jgi:transmembrane sensor
MSIRGARVRALITEEAADWFTTNRRGLDEAKRSQFLSWLKESPVHVEEYLGVTQMTNDLRAAMSHSEFSLDALLERARAEHDKEDVLPFEREATHSRATHSAFRWGLTAAAAAMAVVVLAIVSLWSSTMHVGPGPEKPIIARYATRHGEQLTQRLPDASVLHLNTDTALTIRYTRAERRIDLERGQAVFEVTHDPARPFHVIAGSAEISDVGTTFDVYLHPDSAIVTVLDGEITVQSLQGRGKSAPVQVTAGQQVRVVPGQGPLLPTPVDAKGSTAWLQGQISFKREPLADVAAEFNRYAATPIEIETPSLQRLLVSGVFRTDDPESFLAFLRTIEGVQINITPTRIEVYRP